MSASCSDARLWAGGCRKACESRSAGARAGLGTVERLDVDFIPGLSPVLAGGERSGTGGPRATSP